MNVILLFPAEIDEKNRVRLTDVRARHIGSVLRAQRGQTVRIGLLNGPFGQGTVEVVADGEVLLSCAFEATVPSRPAIDLLLAMPRPKVLKRLWAQFATLGLGRIILTNAEKVERFYFDTHVLDPEFYTARLIEGLQQARDTRLPEVKVARNLKSFLEEEMFPDIEMKMLADPSGELMLRDCLKAGGTAGRCCLAIGPEGGWTQDELDLFRSHGFEVFGLGPRILRTDTACIGLITMLAEMKRSGI